MNKPGRKFGHLVSKETRRKIGLATLGRKVALKTKKKMSQIAKQKDFRKRLPIMYGDNHPNWKGGITPIYTKIKNTIEYKEWRRTVFIKDNYTCQICGERGGILQADHKKSQSIFPELRCHINNGRTLCVPCHYFVTWGKEIGDSQWGRRKSSLAIR